MSAKIIATLLLAASSTFSHAAMQTWNFSYQGLQHTFYEGQDWDQQTTTVWEPDTVLLGHFRAEDSNQDGIIGPDEVRSLYLSASGRDYATCQSGDYYACGIGSFSYSQAGGLHFSVGENHSDPEGIVWGYESFNTNRGWYSEQHHFSWLIKDAYYITAQTRFTLSSPVPEAETWGMLGLGLIGLAGLQARRQRRAAK